MTSPRRCDDALRCAPPLHAWAERPWHNIQDSVLSIEQHLVDCLKHGGETATSGADNLKTLALVDAAYDSAAERRPDGAMAENFRMSGSHLIGLYGTALRTASRVLGPAAYRKTQAGNLRDL